MLIALFVSLAFTVAALAGVIWTGIRRRRRAHYAFVSGHLALLAIAVAFAENYGRTLEFVGTALTLHRLHFGGVVVTLAFLPLLVISGVRLAKSAAETEPARRLSHRRAAFAYVVVMLITFVLGLAMTFAARHVAA